MQSATDIDKPATIHPSAVVSPRARIGHDCYIGPYSIVGDEVELGDGVRLEAHCVIDGRTTIGEATHVFPFVSIGLASQDLKYTGEPSQTRIGKRNRIREFVTIHRGTKGGGMLTQTGDDCLIMAQAHIAHDCVIGDGVIMANGATLAGHVRVEEQANIGAYSGVHQLFGGGQRCVALRLDRRQSCALLRVERHGNEASRLFARGDRCSAPCVSPAAVREVEHVAGHRANQGRTNRL